MAVLETLNAEAVLQDRMDRLVVVWNENDPPAGANYDVDALEFDPLKINQEVSTYFELLVRDRVNQAARATTLAFAVGTDLDAIASRYPGGVPRLAGESDDRYRRRIWLSPNPLSPHGTAEAYEFFALSALSGVRDAAVTKIRSSLRDDPIIIVSVMMTGANPVPTPSQLLQIRSYIIDEKRAGATDVVSVRGPILIDTSYKINVWLYPGIDQDALLTSIRANLTALVENLRWLGRDHTLLLINGAVALPGVHSAEIVSPLMDVRVPNTHLVRVKSVDVVYKGRRE